MFNIPAVAVSYLIGSLSFAVIVSKYYGMDDPRTYGSGNPGATNVLRSGKKGGRADALGRCRQRFGCRFACTRASRTARFIRQRNRRRRTRRAGRAYVAGVFGFKGGKGVATALGVLLALSPATALVCALIWLVMAFGFKVSSLAALVATTAAPLPHCFYAAYFLDFRNPRNRHIGVAPP